MPGALDPIQAGVIVVRHGSATALEWAGLCRDWRKLDRSRIPTRHKDQSLLGHLWTVKPEAFTLLGEKWNRSRVIPDARAPGNEQSAAEDAAIVHWWGRDGKAEIRRRVAAVPQAIHAGPSSGALFLSPGAPGPSSGGGASARPVEPRTNSPGNSLISPDPGALIIPGTMRITEAARFYAASVFWLRRMMSGRAVSPERLRRRQISRLRAVLSHAQGRYPFYRARLEAVGIDPDRFADLEDLRGFGLLDRETYRGFRKAPRRNPAPLPGDDLRPDERQLGKADPRPSGRREERARQTAKFFMALFLNGYRIRDRPSRSPCPAKRPSGTAGPGSSGSWERPAFRGGEDVTVVDRRLSPPPTPRSCTPICAISSGWRLYAAERGLPLARPKLCVSYGETMDGASRKILAEAFGGGNIVQMYGSAEFGRLGFQTRTAPFFHLSHETNYFELERGPPPRAPAGSILVTDLYPRPCPLIRYRLGDSVVFGLETRHPGPPLDHRTRERSHQAP